MSQPLPTPRPLSLSDEALERITDLLEHVGAAIDPDVPLPARQLHASKARIALQTLLDRALAATPAELLSLARALEDCMEEDEP